MSQTRRVILALAIGLAAGIALGAAGPARAAMVGGIVAAAETVGTLWVNGIRMTVIPLIVSLLVVGVAAPGESSHVGRLGLRAFALFYASLAAVALLVAVVAPPLFARLHVDPAAAAALRGGVAAAPVAAIPTFREWLVAVVPVNPVQSAAEGALLPLLVFTLAFAAALRRVAAPAREQVVLFFRGIADAMLVLVRWVLLLAPAGVLALALVLGTRLGASAVGALGFYVGVEVALHAVVLALLYPLVAWGGGVSMRRFARAAAPAQAVAASSRSSLAALPAMIDGARHGLGLPERVTGFVLPLAVTTYRLGAPISWTVGAVFVGRLYGVPLAPAQIALFALASVVLNATAPGVPSGGLLVQAPLYAAVGLPVEGLAILIAVDMAPDVCRTVVNVTADLAAAAVLGRGAPE